LLCTDQDRGREQQGAKLQLALAAYAGPAARGRLQNMAGLELLAESYACTCVKLNIQDRNFSRLELLCLKHGFR